MDKPNIILIGIDTFRFDHFNNKYTPNLFKLAKKGIFFNNTFATTIRTDPAFTSIFTGKYPLNHGLLNHGKNVKEEERQNIKNSIFISEFLKNEGYHTLAVDWLGRWHKRGFDNYSGMLKLPNEQKDKYINIRSKKLFLSVFQGLDVLCVKLINRDFFTNFYHIITKEKYLYDRAKDVTDKAISMIKEAKNPFYLYIHYWDPHHPYITPASIIETIKNSSFERYKNEIKYMDGHIGRLIDFLIKTEKINNTLLIFFGDHGENIYEHGFVIQHKGLYDSTIHIPMILYFPEKFESQENDALVQYIDVFPTIVELINPSMLSSFSFDGKSLLPIINGKKKKIRNIIFAEDFSPGGQDMKKIRRRCIRDKKYKYIQNIYGDGNEIHNRILDYNKVTYKEELYNIEYDKKELNIINSNNIMKFYRKKMHQFLDDVEKKLEISKNNTQFTDDDDNLNIQERLESLGYL